MSDDFAVRVEIRHHGRRYAASALPNGSTTIDRDGVWLCNADWNGRALFAGDHEVHADLDASNQILEALAEALRESGVKKLSRRGEEVVERKRGRSG